MQKADLIKEIVEIKEKINENLETPFAPMAETMRLSKYKKFELENELECAKTRLDLSIKEKARREWLKTDEGKKAIEEYEKKENEIHEKLKEYASNSMEKVRNLIKEFLGERWSCNGDTRYMYVGLLEKGVETPEHSGHFIFGHTFDLYFDHDYAYENGMEGETFVPRINYGCLGAFKPMNDEDRVEFLNGLAKFSGNKELINELRNISIEVSKYKTEIGKKCVELKKEFDNRTK